MQHFASRENRVWQKLSPGVIYIHCTLRYATRATSTQRNYRIAMCAARATSTTITYNVPDTTHTPPQNTTPQSITARKTVTTVCTTHPLTPAPKGTRVENLHLTGGELTGDLASPPPIKRVKPKSPRLSPNRLHQFVERSWANQRVPMPEVWPINELDALCSTATGDRCWCC